MRFEGSLKSWNDERGFGFIKPRRGEQEIFVHIKAFDRSTKRPEAGLSVSFEIEPGNNGQKRAKRVQILHRSKTAKLTPVKVKRDGSPAVWGAASYFAIVLFLLIFMVATIAWRMPAWVIGWYVAASVTCFVAYAMDKSAAVAGRRRISESALIFWGLTGGWPGAIVAQQVLRHKSVKAKFRAVFWTSVIANVILFLVLSSPMVSLFIA